MPIFGRTQLFKRKLESMWNTLYRVAYSWTHDPYQAHDLVQETIARTLQKKDKISDSRSLEIWLFKVMSNYWKDLLRRSKEHITLEDQDLVEHDTPDTINTRLDLVEQVRKAMQQLNADHRQILSLVILQGFSYEEVANILSIPVGTVMSRICRARHNIKQILDQKHNGRGSSTNLWRVK